MKDVDVVTAGWDCVARGDWDTLLKDYAKDMIFVMPGQADVLTGAAAFRKSLDSLGDALPPGFAITNIRQIGETNEIISILDWTCNKVPNGSQLAVLFRFTQGKIQEERWFIDTEQWKAAL